MRMNTQRPPTDWVAGDWAERQARRVATEVRRLRGSRSARWLAERTKELGFEVTRNQLSDLENGRRRLVTVAELMVLARALDTTPIALLYPDPCADEIEMLPDVTTSGPYAPQWFSGMVDVALDAHWIRSDAVCDNPVAYRRNLRPIEAARQIWELSGRMAALTDELRDKSAKEQRPIFSAIADIQRQINKLKADDGR
jgi:transcriptional regulator with XRE-family HTH domain